MTLKTQYELLSRQLIQKHPDLIDSFLDKKFDPFEISERFAVNCRSVSDEILTEDRRNSSVKEIFIVPLTKKEHQAFCIAFTRSNSSYEILLNYEVDKTDEFYSNLIELLNLLIINKDSVKRHIDYSQNAVKAFTALSSILLKLSQNKAYKEELPINKPAPHGIKIKPQEGNCAVQTDERRELL